MSRLDALARFPMLGSLLAHLQSEHGGYSLVDHWTQGEFHHDLA